MAESSKGAARTIQLQQGFTEAGHTGRAKPRTAPAASVHRVLYLSPRLKFSVSVLLALAWAALSYRLAGRWIADLSHVVGSVLAYLAIFSIAIVPGFINAFLVCGLLLDRRPRRRRIDVYPGVSILVAAYNEQDSIVSTVESIARQGYPGDLDVIVVDDGSTDNTLRELSRLSYPW